MNYSSAHWTKGNLPPKGNGFFSFTFMDKNYPKKYYQKKRRKFWNISLKIILTKLEKLNTKVLSVFLRINYIRRKGAAASCLTVTIWRPPLARMMRNCRRWLKLIGVNNLSNVLTLNYLQAGCYSQVRYWTL
jgi:hypothetical protein